jgi:hypothetical protein
VDPAPLAEVEEWVAGLRRFWEQRLDALGTDHPWGTRTAPHDDRRCCNGRLPTGTSAGRWAIM